MSGFVLYTAGETSGSAQIGGPPDQVFDVSLANDNVFTPPRPPQASKDIDCRLVLAVPMCDPVEVLLTTTKITLAQGEDRVRLPGSIRLVSATTAAARDARVPAADGTTQSLTLWDH